MSQKVVWCTPAALQAVLDRSREKALRAVFQARYESEVLDSGVTGSGVRHFDHASPVGGLQNHKLCPLACAASIAMSGRATMNRAEPFPLLRHYCTTNSPAMFCLPIAATRASTSVCGSTALPVMSRARSE